MNQSFASVFIIFNCGFISLFLSLALKDIYVIASEVSPTTSRPIACEIICFSIVERCFRSSLFPAVNVAKSTGESRLAAAAIARPEPVICLLPDDRRHAEHIR